MALVNYMGNAPGFMSYNRQRSKTALGMVDPYKPAKQAAPLKELGDDFAGNPGDKQWLYDRNEAFNSGLTSLYNEYGGEMDWVTTDPRYKQLVAADKNFISNQEAAIQNKENTTKRKKDLSTMGSGQADADFEMIFVDGAWIPKKIDVDGEGKPQIKTKGDYLQETIWNPQEVEYDDGSIGIGHTQYDYGTGNENDWNALVGAFLTDTGDHSWARSNTQSSSINNDVVNAGRAELHKRASSGESNWEQINDATDYLVQYGFDTNHEYFIAQEMTRDFANGRSFKKPRTDEEGNIVYDKKTGRPKMENYYMTQEDISNPDRVKFLTQFYVQDRVEKYAKKYLKTSSESETVDDVALDNIDPKTGLPIEDPSKRRWEAITGWDDRPTGAGFTDSFTEYTKNEDGVIVPTTTTGEIYNDSNLPQGMDQAREALVGSSIASQLGQGNTRVKVGGKWVTIPESTLQELVIADVQDVRYVKGRGGDMELVARSFVFFDEDTEHIDNIPFYNATTRDMDVVGNSSVGYTGIASMNDAAENQGIIKSVSSAESEKYKDYKSFGDEGWDISTESNDYGVWIDVPVNNQAITWDQQAVGERRASEGEQIEVGGRVNVTSRNRQRSEAIINNARANSAYE